MGRNCYGDIEFSFACGIQDSNAASQFGGERDINFIPYCYYDMSDFDVEHLDSLISKANKLFSIKIDKDDPNFIDVLYSVDIYPNYKETEEQRLLLADIELGILIYQCIKENGSCEFQAEHF